MIFMVQVNRVYLIIIFFNRPQFLVDNNVPFYIINVKPELCLQHNLVQVKSLLSLIILCKKVKKAGYILLFRENVVI